jgi:hypothetical protein
MIVAIRVSARSSIPGHTGVAVERERGSMRVKYPKETKDCSEENDVSVVGVKGVSGGVLCILLMS